MFSEDTDLCRRLRNDGIPVLYLPGVSVVHLGGGSKRLQRSHMASLFVENLYRYYQKHHSRIELAEVVLALRAITSIKAARSFSKFGEARAWSTRLPPLVRTRTKIADIPLMIGHSQRFNAYIDLSTGETFVR
ncbi:MAG: hypothetical protein H0T59_00665 [Chloroflexi bacterium]|nr:hypothetical protein [Chloroflexota bacterium]